jgi:hypothetical protein
MNSSNNFAIPAELLSVTRKIVANYNQGGKSTREAIKSVLGAASRLSDVGASPDQLIEEPLIEELPAPVLPALRPFWEKEEVCRVKAEHRWILAENRIQGDSTFWIRQVVGDLASLCETSNGAIVLTCPVEWIEAVPPEKPLEERIHDEQAAAFRV